MKTVILSIVFLLGTSNIAFMLAQSNKMVVEGSIQIGNSTADMPNPGSIRWSGVNFEGWDGKEWVSLTGDHSLPISDVEGNIYRTVVIGEQVWMAENLRTTKYKGGTAIPEEQSTSIWPNLTIPAFCWYQNDSSQYAPIYGALYNWYATAGDSLCPTGWHVPMASEWDQLAMFLGGTDVAGEKMKQKVGTLWLSGNIATNSSGFTGLPGGYRRSDTGNFQSERQNAFFFTATETTANDAEGRFLNFSVANLLSTSSNFTSKQNGYSIRCIKN